LRTNVIHNRDTAAITIPPLLKVKEDGSYIWRTDLAATEQHWLNWFQGLSSSFLRTKCSKLLILAGTDRLDKDLMIGQMQGKFRCEIIPECDGHTALCGHYVHEDAPVQVATILQDFAFKISGKTIKVPLPGGGFKLVSVHG